MFKTFTAPSMCVCALFFCGHAAYAQGVYFMGMGSLPHETYFSSLANGISADGTRSVGESLGHAFLWDQQHGMTDVAEGRPFRSDAWSISPDGRYVVGDSASGASNTEAFMWSESTGMVAMGGLPYESVWSYAADVSNNGQVVVGLSKSWLSGERGEAYRWTPEHGMEGLGFLPGSNQAHASGARGVSADGSVIVGGSSSAAGGESGGEAFRWTEQTGMVSLGDLPGSIVASTAFAVSNNGDYIVGQGQSDNGLEAFLWSENEGMVGLGDLPGWSFSSIALDVSDDGNRVVGWGQPASSSEAFLWERGKGIRSMEDVLLDYGIDIHELGWGYLPYASAITPDGNTIVGLGAGPNGPEAWIAHIPSPGTFPLLALAGLGLTRRRR